MEMCRHLPSSTHSGDKHSSIPESLHVRPGTDRAVHLGNKARDGGRVRGCWGVPGSRTARWRAERVAGGLHPQGSGGGAVG